MSNDLSEAKQKLKEYLDMNPDQNQMQVELDLKLANLSNQERLMYIFSSMGVLTKQLNSLFTALRKEVDDNE